MATLRGIFFLDQGKCSLFQIYPIEAAEGDLRDWVNLSGGLTLDKEEYGSEDLEQNAIPIIDFDFLVKSNAVSFAKPPNDLRDFFKPDFIYESYTENKKMDLNLFKIEKLESSGCLNNYNANDLVSQKISWKDILKTREFSDADKEPGLDPSDEPQVNDLPEFNLTIGSNGSPPAASTPIVQAAAPTAQATALSKKDPVLTARKKADFVEAPKSQRSTRIRSPTSQGSKKTVAPPSSSSSDLRLSFEDESSSGSSFVESLTKGKTAKKKRRDYDYEEDLAILRYIEKIGIHECTGGRVMWQDMEKEKVCGSRTWQSMKEHFRMYILKYLDKYGISDAERENFKDAEVKRAEGKRLAIYEDLKKKFEQKNKSKSK